MMYGTLHSSMKQVVSSSACYALHAGFFLCLLFDPDEGERYAPAIRWLNFDGLHGVISQKREIFRRRHIYKWDEKSVQIALT
jgi:hypothetical protein